MGYTSKFTGLQIDANLTKINGIDTIPEVSDSYDPTSSKAMSGKAINDAVSIDYINNCEYEYVDMGDGLLWATYNVGASTVNDYGLLFLWGRVQGDTYGTQVNSLTTSSAPATASGATYSSEGQTLSEADDAASVNMGGYWRMPTKEEFVKLYQTCTNQTSSTYTDNLTTLSSTENPSNGVYWIAANTTIKGTTYTVPGTIFVSTNGNTLFFPATGNWDGYDGCFYSLGSNGFYWSSALFSSSFAYGLYFDSSYCDSLNNSGRYNGYSVRGVQ